MVNAMFAVLIAGSIGWVLSGWVGVAVGATVASAVAVLTEALSPPIERGTSHERRMRRDRRYRARYEALEAGWRRPVPRRRRAWQPSSRRSGDCPACPDCTRRAGAHADRAGPRHPGAGRGRLETSWSQGARGEVESHCRSSLVKREVGQQAGASKRKRPAQARGQSIASAAGWHSTRVATTGVRTRVTRRRLERHTGANPSRGAGDAPVHS